MKKPAQLLFFCSLIFFGCQAMPGNDDKSKEEKIKDAIINYRTDTVEMGAVVFIDSLAILNVDSLTKKEFAIKASDRFKKLIYLNSGTVTLIQKEIDAYSKLKNNERLQEYKLQLDTVSTMLQAAQKSLDSCNRIIQESDVNTFGGYIVSVYSKMRSEGRMYYAEEQYLITKDMKVRYYQNWDNLLKQYTNPADIPEVKTSTQK
jgi:hypothetical protein